MIEQDPKSDEIIRPVLRGRDIKRYGYDFADLYVITTFPSLKIDIEMYPAVKKHLLSFGYDRLKQTGELGARKKTNNKWFETSDSISYWDDFSKQKIVWAELARTGNAFAFDDKQFFVNNTGYILTSSIVDKNKLLYFLAVLNSQTMLYYLDIISTKLDETGWRWLRQYVELLPVPSVESVNQELYKQIVDETKNGDSKKLNHLIYLLFKLTGEEKTFVMSRFGNY